MDLDRKSPQTAPSRPVAAPRSASPDHAPLPASGEEMTPAGMITLQGAAGNRNANLALQRASTGTSSSSTSGEEVEEAEETGSRSSSSGSRSSRLSQASITRRSLAASISGRTGNGRIDTNSVKKALTKRLTAGPPFSHEEMEQIRALTVPNHQWLKETGIGTYAEADQYFALGKYYDWLKLNPGKRILIASIAWERGRLRDGRAREGEIPNNPAYTLGRTLAIHGTGGDGTPYLGDGDRGAHENERNRQIHDAFVHTLDEGSWPANPDVTRQHRETNSRALSILTKVLLILQNGLQVYSASEKKHVDYREGDVARALAHGGRVNIRIPETGGAKNARAFTDYLGLTEVDEKTGKHRDAKKDERRGIGTHRMRIRDNKPGRRGRFEEKGGGRAGAQNLLGSVVEDRPIYGPNPAIDGIGRTDFNGDVILPDGAHGHMFLAFTPPKANRDGALQVGIETLAPHNDNSPVGYKHTWRSTEKTANPESSAYGHKQDKIGEGKLRHNQRYVDMAGFKTTDGGGWEQFLKLMQAKWDTLYDAAKEDDARRRALYDRLVGPRGDHFRPDAAA